MSDERKNILDFTFCVFNIQPCNDQSATAIQPAIYTCKS